MSPLLRMKTPPQLLYSAILSRFQAPCPGASLSSERKWGAKSAFPSGARCYLGAPDFLLPDASHPLHRTVQYHTRNGCRVLLLAHGQSARWIRIVCRRTQCP